MSEFEFGFDDFWFGDDRGKTFKKEEKKKIPSKLIIILVMFAVLVILKNSSSIVDYFSNIVSEFGDNGGDSIDNGDNSTDDKVTDGVTLREKGYFTDQYQIPIEIMDVVQIGDKAYYSLDLLIRSREFDEVNILSPTREMLFYNTGKNDESIKVTVPVQGELRLTLPLRPVTSFNRKFVPVIIFSSEESVYDYILIDTGVPKNNPLPPAVKEITALNVDSVTHAEMVSDNVILARFKITLVSGGEEVRGALVEIELPDDSYEFAKNRSNIIIAPTLIDEYELLLYIVKKSGSFMPGEQITTSISLKTLDGVYIDKNTVIIVKE